MILNDMPMITGKTVFRNEAGEIRILPSIDFALPFTVCAWCVKKETSLAIIAQFGGSAFDRLSHGICPDCRATFLDGK